MLTLLKALWVRWKAIAVVIGDFQSRLILSLFYFVVFVPVGFMVRLAGDPLRIGRDVGARWLDRPAPADIATGARRQY